MTAGHRSMNVFFDIDKTIQGEDGSLRPGTRELFSRLVEEGHRVYVWSGMGVRWDDVRRHDLGDLVSDVYCKPINSFSDGLERFSIPVVPDFIVDDYPSIVEHFGGMCIREYWALLEQPDDKEMGRVYEGFKAHCTNSAIPA